MEPWHWTALGAAAGCLLTLVAQVVRRWWLRHQFAWQRLPWYYESSRYNAPTGFNAPHLVEALKRAESALSRHTRWNAGQVAGVMQTLHVRVLPHEDCEEARSLKMQGLHGGRIVVGSTLWGLCHELAHLCEVQLEKEADMGHITWSTNGVWAAMAEYESWLTKEMGTWR